MAEGPTTQVTRVVGHGEAARRVMRACTLLVRTGAAAGKKVRMEQPLFRIGSHPSNDLQLSDPTVSRHHLEVSVTEEGWRLVDLGSSNGTRAGALKLGEIVVEEAVTLTLGETRIELVPSDGEAEIPSSSSTRFGLLFAQSVAMRELFAKLEAVAHSDCSVLLEGETGVGKERVAESVHRESARAAGPFVVIDCEALSSTLLESELFGHVRGAFTGAEHDRQGLLERADGGTLFLDGVGELPMALQTKLFGALERRRVTPLGGTSGRKVDLRVIAATQRNLPRAVNEGLFRAELFYRLAVVRLRIPPLRERLEDLPLLVDEMLAELREREGDSVPSELSAVATARLLALQWPGNVRELRNTVEAAVLRLPTGTRAERVQTPTVPPFFTSREAALAQFHQRYFGRWLKERNPSYSRMARETGLDRRYLHRILKRHGLRLPDTDEE